MSSEVSAGWWERRSRKQRRWLVVAAVVVVLAVLGNIIQAFEDPPVEPATATPAVTTEQVVIDQPEASEPAPTTATSSQRPSWCRHYDEWERANTEAERIAAQYGDVAAEWPADELKRWSDLVEAYADAARRMWAEAPDEARWDTAEAVCGTERTSPYPVTAAEAFEPCVSAWDGNHNGLEELIRGVLNDPDSMETHGTYYSPDDSTGDGTILIRLDYSAANLLGGKARTDARALMDVETCEITEVTTYGSE